ncbi:MAG TPA: class E sortase [Acidimicrobiia bacterium]|jgi:sortase A
MTKFRCRSPLLFALAFALVFGAAAIAVTPGRAQGQSSLPSLVVAPPNVVPTVAARAVEPTLATAAATPPTPPPPPNPAPPLPVPAALPNPATRVPLVAFGRIQIPKIGLDQVVHEGVEQMVIDAGPAHWPGTAAFGSWGNVVLAGHRTTHTEPFLRVAELNPGDPIILSDAVGTYTYHVTGVEIVPNTALSIVDQHPGRTLTIFSCHPIGSSAQRIVVHAVLMSTPRPGQ